MRTPLVAFALLTLVPAAGRAADLPGCGESRYFFTLYAGQSVPFRLRTGHTWATFAKITPTAGGQLAVEAVTISWLPAEMPVQPLRLRPATGRNRSLDETFALMAAENSQVSVWGPFEIDAHRYEKGVSQARDLESGSIRFRSIDSFSLNRRIINCVHAIVQADPVLWNRPQPVLRVGEPGTSKLVKMYARTGAFVGGPVPHPWVLGATGASHYPAIPRSVGERVPRRWK